MEYGTFKALQGVLFFGAALGFGLWQLALLRRLRRKRDEAQAGAEEGR
jgi:hypothetical protein